MNRHLAKLCGAAGIVVLLGSLVGCGTGEYERRLGETVKGLKQGSAFGQFSPPSAVPGTSVMLQLPQFFEQSPLPDDSDPRRLKPAGIDLEGLRVTYEGFVADSDGGKQPFYCYLGAAQKDPERRLESQLRAAFPDSFGRWEAVDCPTPDGRTVTWQKLECNPAEQEFYYVDKQKQEKYTRMPGKIVLYKRQEGDWFVLIGWRMPAAIEKFIGPENDQGLDKWAPRVAGTVTAK